MTTTPTQEEVQRYLCLKAMVRDAEQEIATFEERWSEALPANRFGERILIADAIDVKIYAERPLVEEWDQEELSKAATELLASGFDYSVILKTTYEVDKRILKRQAPEIQKLVDRARIMSGHRKNGEPRKPRFTVEG